jgi:hypothetical protein
MLVFIDESGDSGFKPGASPIFVAVMVIFENSQDAMDRRLAVSPVVFLNGSCLPHRVGELPPAHSSHCGQQCRVFEAH